jgi:hypothetical protein
MVQFLSLLDKLLAAAPTLLSERPMPCQPKFAARSRKWSDALHSIYDDVLSEPVPPRLAEMVRRERSRKN